MVCSLSHPPRPPQQTAMCYHVTEIHTPWSRDYKTISISFFFLRTSFPPKRFMMSSSNEVAAVSELLVKKKKKKKKLQEALYSPPAHHHRLCSGVCLWARLVSRGKGCKYVGVCQLQTAFVTIKAVELRGFHDCREAVRWDFVVFAKAKLSQAFFFF